jgi:hypothetical protein
VNWRLRPEPGYREDAGEPFGLKRKVTTYSPFTGVPLIIAGTKCQSTTVLAAVATIALRTGSSSAGFLTDCTRPLGPTTRVSWTSISFRRVLQSCGGSFTGVVKVGETGVGFGVAVRISGGGVMGSFVRDCGAGIVVPPGMTGGGSSASCTLRTAAVCVEGGRLITLGATCAGVAGFSSARVRTAVSAATPVWAGAADGTADGAADGAGEAAGLGGGWTTLTLSVRFLPSLL